MALNTRQLAYRDEDARLNGFVAVDPTRGDKRPGILVVHGGAGLDDHARGRARRFAEAGFVAFACDMYGEAVVGRDAIMRHVMELRNNRELSISWVMNCFFRSRDIRSGRAPDCQ